MVHARLRKDDRHTAGLHSMDIDQHAEDNADDDNEVTMESEEVQGDVAGLLQFFEGLIVC